MERLAQLVCVRGALALPVDSRREPRRATSSENEPPRGRERIGRGYGCKPWADLAEPWGGVKRQPIGRLSARGAALFGGGRVRTRRACLRRPRCGGLAFSAALPRPVVKACRGHRAPAQRGKPQFQSSCGASVRAGGWPPNGGTRFPKLLARVLLQGQLALLPQPQKQTTVAATLKMTTGALWAKLDEVVANYGRSDAPPPPAVPPCRSNWSCHKTRRAPSPRSSRPRPALQNKHVSAWRAAATQWGRAAALPTGYTRRRPVDTLATRTDASRLSRRARKPACASSAAARACAAACAAAAPCATDASSGRACRVEVRRKTDRGLTQAARCSMRLTRDWRLAPEIAGARGASGWTVEAMGCSHTPTPTPTSTGWRAACACCNACICCCNDLCENG